MYFRLEPDSDSHVEILLFREVQNAKEIRAKLFKGQLAAALLQAPLVADVFQLLVATASALEKQKRSALVTRTVHTEIVYNLSASRNISKALERFGMSDSSKDVIAVLPNATAADVVSVRDAIQGIEDINVAQAIKLIADEQLIRGTYGITEEERHDSLVDSIVTRMACRDVK